MQLNAIFPDGTLAPNFHEHAAQSNTTRKFYGVQTLWNRFDISRFGQYSSGRIERLKTYRESTSFVRVVLMCTLMPWPPVMLELLTELIPLQDPIKGWKANHGSWIRLWIAVAVGSCGVLYQLQTTTPELSNWNIVLITFTTAWIATGMSVLLSSIWVFPLPFCIFGAGVLTTFLLAVFFVVAIQYGRASTVYGSSIMTGRLLRQRIFLIIVQAIFVSAYTTFSILFGKCSPMAQMGLLLVLPIIKFALKHLVAWIVSDDPETIPSAVVFSVDVFNGLYSAVCIQSSVSWHATLIVIALNALHSAFSFMAVNESAKSLMILTRDTTKLKKRSQTLLNRAMFRDHPDKVEVLSFTKAASPVHLTVKRKQNALISMILFQLEYHALVLYIDAVIPLVYGFQLSILYCLPSARYYPHTQSLSPDQFQTIVGSILAYALSGIMYLVCFHMILKRKLGFSLLYQLAFTLETELGLLQARLFVWIVILLQYTLVHFGTS